MTKKMEEFIEAPWDPNRYSQIPIEKFDEKSLSFFRKYLKEPVCDDTQNLNETKSETFF